MAELSQEVQDALTQHFGDLRTAADLHQDFRGKAWVILPPDPEEGHLKVLLVVDQDERVAVEMSETLMALKRSFAPHNVRPRIVPFNACGRRATCELFIVPNNPPLDTAR